MQLSLFLQHTILIFKFYVIFLHLFVILLNFLKIFLSVYGFSEMHSIFKTTKNAQEYFFKLPRGHQKIRSPVPCLVQNLNQVLAVCNALAELDTASTFFGKSNQFGKAEADTEVDHREHLCTKMETGSNHHRGTIILKSRHEQLSV